MFPASALYGKPASGKAGTWETFQTFLLISTRSCGACWVKNWGELAPVSIIKKHVRKNGVDLFSLFLMSSASEK